MVEHQVVLKRRGWSRRATLVASVLLALRTSLILAQELELNEPGVMSVSTESMFPPFSMRTPQGEFDGVEIRLWKEIANRFGLEYKPVPLKWESTLVGLMSGQFDVMGTP